MIVIYATLPLQAEYREDALAAIEDLVEDSQAEPGVIDYRATTDVSEPNTVRFVEQYESEAAFEAHLGTDHYREFAKSLPEWLAGEPTVVQFDVAERTELDL
jgi:quinol monooxygenase YgiN